MSRGRKSDARTNAVILKIGGSVLTDKNRESTARPEQIRRIAAEIGAARASRLVLVHGAGSFGHHQAKEFGLKEGLNGQSIRGIMPTHNAVRSLSDMIIGELYACGVYAAPVHPLSSCTLKNGRIAHICMDVIEQMLASGIVPVLHGDVAMDTARGIDVLSGDQLVVYLAEALGAEKAGIGTNVDGVYGGVRTDVSGEGTKDFKVIHAITPSNLGEVKESLSGSGGVDVTGGMYGKIMELAELAKAGIPSFVFNAEKPGNVARFLRGEPIEGTVISGD
ncbi:MAG: Isopentenyl phosphate kinase [Methanocella sp. PtaU1.Bin125]|nr:MAG: Isopentenyl phosphate kinase [Methanocella sp. PtaU1.Bin125]